jgi:hypothetical protein
MSSGHRTGRKRSTVGACERECRRLRSQATGEMTAFDHARRRMFLLRRKIDAQQQARQERCQELSRRPPLDDLALRPIARTLDDG